MQNLKSNTMLKRLIGGIFSNDNLDLKSEEVKQTILMNSLIQNDLGYNIPQVFEILEKSHLHFLSMTNWRHWDVRDLFNNKNNLPTIWEFILENASEKEKLHYFEL